jgi:hypothetical protein
MVKDDRKHLEKKGPGEQTWKNDGGRGYGGFYSDVELA